MDRRGNDADAVSATDLKAQAKAVAEAFDASLKEPANIGWTDAASGLDAFWCLPFEMAPENLLKLGREALGDGDEARLKGFESSPAAADLPLSWLGKSLEPDVALPRFVEDVLESAFDSGAGLKEALEAASEQALGPAAEDSALPPWIPKGVVVAALASLRLRGRARAPSPGEMMEAALAAGDAESLANLAERFGRNPSMAHESDEACFWAWPSQGWSEEFCGRAIGSWKPGFKATLESAGWDLTGPVPGKGWAWTDAAALAGSKVAFDELGGRLADPESVGEAAVELADRSALALALAAGADPNLWLKDALTKDRSVGGSSKMACARALLEAGADLSLACEAESSCLFEDFLDGWELWEAYFDEAGLSWADLLPTARDELAVWERLAIKCAAALEEGLERIFDGPWGGSSPEMETCEAEAGLRMEEPAQEPQGGEKGERTDQIRAPSRDAKAAAARVEKFMEDRPGRVPEWLSELWPAISSRLEEAELAAAAAPAAKGKPRRM